MLWDLGWSLTSNKYLTKLSRKSTFSSMFRVWVVFMEYVHWNAMLAEISKDDPATWALHRRGMWFLPSRNSWSVRIDKTIKEYQGHRVGLGQDPSSVQSQSNWEESILSFRLCWFYIINTTSVLIFITPSGEVKGGQNKEWGKMSVLHLTWRNLKLYGCKSNIDNSHK